MSQITVIPSAALGLPLDITNPGEITGATQNSLVIGGAGGQLTSLGVASDGQIPIGSTGNAAVLATLTAGANINIVNGAGSITVSATGLGPEFQDDVFRVYDDGDNTKKIAFEADQITTGTTRTITMCDQDLSLISPSFPGAVTSGLDLTVTAGNLNLPSTNAALTEGVIEVNSNRFMHSYGTDNVFIGEDAGNGTLTGSNNIAMGSLALGNLTSGDNNTGLGIIALTDITTGSRNVGIGSGSIADLTTGDNNTALGDSSLSTLTTGSNNISIGYNAGSQLTLADSSNILIGHVGSAGLDNTIRIGTDGSGAGQQDTCHIAGIYGSAPGASSRSMLIDGTGRLSTIGAAANGELIIGSSGNTPSLATLAAGSNINITNGAGSITITATGSGIGPEFQDDVFRVYDDGDNTKKLAFECSAISGSTTRTITMDDRNIDMDAVPTTVATDGSSAIPAAGSFTIAGGTNVTTSGSGSTVTINSTAAGGITWNEVTGTSQAAAVDNGYITNNAALVTVTLPATAAVGETVRILGLGAGGWKVAQNASQYIRWDESNVTTTGTGGDISSTDDHDAVELVCTVTNNGWGVASSKGNIDIT